ncbi:hypothetical protein [Pseudonocardia sp. GCM10023141]|uniref:hypothetical protein n=1 Tax=Pseudonocardia sp. GCM10023141 TaxID=3252653 RepID=UPI0036104096
MTRRGRLLPIVTMSVLTALLVQVVVEFGPLWLVALAAPAVVYGPYWAGVVSSFGLGGVLAGRIDLHRPRTAGTVAALTVLAAAVLCVSDDLLVITAVQALLALLTVAAGIHVSQLLHDAVRPIRAGVTSGTGTLTWLAFLPLTAVRVRQRAQRRAHRGRAARRPHRRRGRAAGPSGHAAIEGRCHPGSIILTTLQRHD